jgi:hypothetical protein
MYKFQTLADVIMEEIVLIKHSLITGQEVVLRQEHEYFLEELDGNIDDLLVESAQAEMLAGETSHCETEQRLVLQCETAYWLANKYREIKAAWREERSKEVEADEIPF